MESMTVTIGGSAYALPVNFAAMRAVAKRAGDPFAMVFRLSDKQPLTAVEVVDLLTAGVLQCKPDAQADDVADAIMRQGVMSLMEPAHAYLLALVTGSSKRAQQPAETDAKK